MTITEYIQQRRMALAEQLLMTTQLEIKEGGYRRWLHFTQPIFKLILKVCWLGVYPHDIKKQPKNKEKGSYHNCLNKLCDVKKATENGSIISVVGNSTLEISRKFINP